jgi:hypothetical protein
MRATQPRKRDNRKASDGPVRLAFIAWRPVHMMFLYRLLFCRRLRPDAMRVLIRVEHNRA